MGQFTSVTDRQTDTDIVAYSDDTPTASPSPFQLCQASIQRFAKPQAINTTTLHALHVSHGVHEYLSYSVWNQRWQTDPRHIESTEFANLEGKIIARSLLRTRADVMWPLATTRRPSDLPEPSLYVQRQRMAASATAAARAITGRASLSLLRWPSGR